MTVEEGLPDRGYHVLYREDQKNICPGCDRTHWYVGRVSAECAFCGTVLDLPQSTRAGGMITCRGPR